MKKWLVIILIILFTAVMSLYAENEVYNSWNQYKPGTFVTYKCTVATAGVSTESTVTYTLKDVAADKVVLNLKSKTSTMGVTVDGPSQDIVITPGYSAKAINIQGLPVQIPTVNAVGAIVSGAAEKMTVKGKEFSVSTTNVKTAVSDVTLTISDEIPGKIVKAVTKTVATTVTMVLVDFNLVK